MLAENALVWVDQKGKSPKLAERCTLALRPAMEYVFCEFEPLAAVLEQKQHATACLFEDAIEIADRDAAAATLILGRAIVCTTISTLIQGLLLRCSGKSAAAGSKHHLNLNFLNSSSGAIWPLTGNDMTFVRRAVLLTSALTFCSHGSDIIFFTNEELEMKPAARVLPRLGPEGNRVQL